MQVAIVAETDKPVSAVKFCSAVKFKSTSQLLYYPISKVRNDTFEIGQVSFCEKKMSAAIVLHRKMPGGGRFKRLAASLGNLVQITPRDVLLTVTLDDISVCGRARELSYEARRKPYADSVQPKSAPITNVATLLTIDNIVRDVVELIEA